MKIGVMLRHYEQHGGGVKVYTRNLLRQFALMDSPHEFVFIYRNPKLIGTYSNGTNIREVAVKASSKLHWDQLAVQKVEKEENFDVIFNPKYSLPLNAKCKTVFVCHGLPWYVMPWASKWLDRMSHKFLIPRYVKKADAIIAVSNITKQHMLQYFNLEHDFVTTVYLGIDREFKKPVAKEKLENIRKKYNLPEKYFLYVGQIYPPKNFSRLLKAYVKVGPEMGISLVAASFFRRLCGEDQKIIDELGKPPWVVWPGWIEHDELPALYAMAEALIMPSLYEACPSPPIEAMGMGCPVVTANRSGTKDVSGDAALFVDPEKVDSIAEGLRKISTDADLREDLIKKGHNRAAEFSWEKCANETIHVLENTAGNK
jgi:glycosyltransferase involved in cell wall biosynthesis